MKKNTKILFSSMCIALSMFSCNNDDDDVKLTASNIVDIGDYKLFTDVNGTGNHTLVFESGLGDTYESWYKLSKLSKQYQTIVYNRAGYTPSESANNERGIVQLAEDLHKVIMSKSENEKVTLVGHSLGGGIIRYYAILHPEKVKALLFVDPSHEDFEDMTQEQEDDMVNYFMNEERPEIVNEAKQFIENFNILSHHPKLPNVPTIVLTSIKHRTGDNKERWINAHASLGKDLSHFTHITTDNSGHYIQVDEPDLVSSSIESLLNN